MRSSFVYSLVIIFFNFNILISAYEYDVKYLDVKIDQFTYTSNKTFKLKYLVNDKYWDRERGPIFFYCGNEGAIEVFCENTGFLWESAERFKALVVFAEHRYYGVSLPFGNETFSTVENRGYLSSLQALEDFVDVLEHIQEEANDASEIKHGKRYPVIAFGGSYGGMLASWFRMKYPHIVQGSLAASAPIWEFVNMAPCDNFNKIVTKVFADTSKNCHNTIKRSWKLIDDTSKLDGGKEWLSKNWKLCTPTKNDNDTTAFKNYLVDMYVTMAMVNYPYPNDFLVPLPGHPIKAFCEILDSSKASNYLLKIFDAAQMYLNSTGKKTCIDWAPGSSVEDLGLQGWSLQTCTEMVMPFCSTEEDIFEPSQWSFDEFSQQCQASWNVTPIENIAEKLYGGMRIDAASNIIFSNGLLDPWSGGGVLHNISDTVIAVIIPEGAHHLDLRSANEADPQSVINARKLYEELFKTWIKEFEKNEARKREMFKERRIAQDVEKNNILGHLQLSKKHKKSLLRMQKNQKLQLSNNVGEKNERLGMFHPNIISKHIPT